MESPFIFILYLCLIFSTVSCIVPPSATFKYVNEGFLGLYLAEYDASYRILCPFASPFQLCFYNTTPNAYTLALRMGTTESNSVMRWVWEANRGNPVRENATLTFGTDGNLVLADADGCIAWQTNTANKGIVGIKLLSNGNLVLHDSEGKYIWESFDYPTDTLLVGQSLKVGGATKLVSRASKKQNINGPYSLVMEDKTLSMYYKSPKSPKPLLYSFFDGLVSVEEGPLNYVILGPDLSLEYQSAEYLAIIITLMKPKYNTTFTYLRLEIDGNIRFYTYEKNANWNAWEVTFTLFNENSDECQLPRRCGNFGLCEHSQCVACPTPKGLLGWSKNCRPPKLTSCGVKGFGYYKIEGVDHFMTKYTRGDGPMKENECSNKCTKNCKCLGYFYNTQSSRCWIAYVLKTLTRVANSTHLVYIKAPNKK